MSRFAYQLQNVLNIKEKLESQAKMEYAFLQGILTEEEQKLATLKKRKLDYLEEGKLLRSNSLNVREIKENKTALSSMDELIEKQLIQVNIAEKNLEAAREKLVEVMQERKTHEKLREKAFEQFMQEEKAQESKEIDELTSYTYGQKTGD